MKTVKCIKDKLTDSIYYEAGNTYRYEYKVEIYNPHLVSDNRNGLYFSDTEFNKHFRVKNTI